MGAGGYVLSNTMQPIHRQFREDGVCVLTFDRPGAPINIFDRATLEELAAQVNALGQQYLDVKGLVLISGKPTVFVAGADLRAISQMSRAELKNFIELGQTTFAAIAALPFPTVAAIHGACVGGGLEVALACDWRVATDDKSTRIGLPETKLGILPAWGGSTRLPKLIGLANALDIILGGKTLPAKPALKKGMIDAIAPKEHLLEAALPLLKGGKRHLKRGLKDTLAAPVIHAAARKQALARTHGHYPAITKALDVAVAASGVRDDSMAREIERDAVLDVAASPIAANLIRLFFLQDRSKKLAVPGAEPGAPVRNAAVIGAGVMGAGIAQWLSSHGVRVILRDVDAARVGVGMATVKKLYDAGAKRHVFSAQEVRDGVERVAPAPAEVPLHRCDIVIEAAVEKMEIKKTIFRRLDALAGDQTILATNTSALSIAELARSTARPERVIGLHFFNPVHQMQLVEVVIAPETSPTVAARALKFAQSIGKLPVLVKDSPGFLVNRILLPGLVEAADLFAHGTDATLIDSAMVDFGMPMGPLRLSDEVGTDIALDVAQTLAAAFPSWMLVPEILPKMIEKGLLGKKAGRGFYVHQKGAKHAVPNNEARALRSAKGEPLAREEISKRIVLLMINEAARCLEEKIVEGPEDVDFAMVMGTGFAPFRGGPLRYADSLGAAAVVRDLEALAATAPHFKPCNLLSEMARNQSRFYEDRTRTPSD